MWIEPVSAGSDLLAEMQALSAAAQAPAAGIAPATADVDAVTGSAATGSAAPADFGSYLAAAIDNVNAQQLDASARMQAVEAGSSTDLVGTMISNQKASLGFSALVQVRNKVMSGMDNIMDMSL